jgi:hypothetical protein
LGLGNLTGSGSPADWANETFRLARTEIYGGKASSPNVAPVVLPPNYAMRESGIVQEQLEKAGVRLACSTERFAD